MYVVVIIFSRPKPEFGTLDKKSNSTKRHEFSSDCSLMGKENSGKVSLPKFNLIFVE